MFHASAHYSLNKSLATSWIIQLHVFLSVKRIWNSYHFVYHVVTLKNYEWSWRKSIFLSILNNNWKQWPKDITMSSTAFVGPVFSFSDWCIRKEPAERDCKTPVYIPCLLSTGLLEMVVAFQDIYFFCSGTASAAMIFILTTGFFSGGSQERRTAAMSYVHRWEVSRIWSHSVVLTVMPAYDNGEGMQ